MGYLSDYEITLKSKDIVDVEKVRDTLNALSRYTFNVNGENLTTTESKWYSWESHMKGLSILYPDILFELERQGEEHDDFERAFFKNGKSEKQKAVVTYSFAEIPDWAKS